MAINHIKWYFNVTKWTPTEQQWLKLLSCVAPEEADRIQKFVYKHDAKSSLIGRALIRNFVSSAIGRPSDELSFIRTDHGRPKVSASYQSSLVSSWPSTFDFNVSHSGDYCILAGFWANTSSPLMTIGVDITQVVSKKSKQELDRFLYLMSRREFTKSEWETVEGVDSDRQKCINFTRLWCLKESYIKSIGLGLSFKLDRIEFRPAEMKRYNLSTSSLVDKTINDTQVYLDGILSENWRFQETALDSEHLVAVAYQYQRSHKASMQHIDQEPFKEVSIESLVNVLEPVVEIDWNNWSKFSSLLEKKR